MVIMVLMEINGDNDDDGDNFDNGDNVDNGG